LEEKMGHQALTLSRHLLTRENTAIPAGDLALVMERIALAGKLIAGELAHASISGELGYSGDTNVQGEKQKKLDDWTNQLFLEIFEHGFPVCSLISEEMEAPKHYERAGRGHKGKNYAVLCDPLDGSSNTDVDGSLGTIFSIRARADGHTDNASDLLAPGSKQVAAGYVLYGPATQLIYTAGAGVDVFTLDPRLGEFMLWKENLKMPERGSTYAVNQGNISKWHPGAQKFVQHLTSRKDKSTSYSLRYCGAFAADFHRCLLEGGIYLYPGEVTSDGKSKGKLRLMYELAPLAMVAEQAGGRASNGKVRILDVVPSAIHDRQPVYIGSAAEVKMAEEFRVEG
jgi:fructose-1,6-bisphosphatase I